MIILNQTFSDGEPLLIIIMLILSALSWCLSWLSSWFLSMIAFFIFYIKSSLIWSCSIQCRLLFKHQYEDQEVSQGVLSRFENEQKGHRCQPGPGWPQKLTGCSWYIRWRTDRIFRKDLCIYRNFANWEIFLQLKLEWQEIWVSLEWERNSRTRFSRHPLARVSTVHLLVEPKPDNLLFFFSILEQ